MPRGQHLSLGFFPKPFANIHYYTYVLYSKGVRTIHTKVTKKDDRLALYKCLCCLSFITRITTKLLKAV